MGEKDTLTKHFMSRPEVFADAFNYLMYEGEPVIRSEKLSEVDTTAIAVAYAGQSQVSIQKVRDVLKEWTCMADDEMAYMVLGVENQSNIHYAMPVRNMVYDAIQYENQVKMAGKTQKKKDSDAQDKKGEYLSHFTKSDKLKPVVTLVVYFGDKEWDAPTSLYEMFGPVPPRALPFISDYKMNLICPLTMKTEKLDRLTSDFKEAMEFIKWIHDRQNLIRLIDENPMFDKMKTETALMLKAISGLDFEIDTREEQTNMRTAIHEMMDERDAKSKAEGRAEGRAEGIMGSVQLLLGMNLSYQDVFGKIKEQYHLTDAQTENYMKMAEA